jgi:hypothetical protein
LRNRKLLYKKAYEQFENEEYDSSLQTINEAYAIGENDFTPTLELLKILIAGKTEDIVKYPIFIRGIRKAHNDEEIGTYAKKTFGGFAKFSKEPGTEEGHSIHSVTGRTSLFFNCL